MSKIEEFFNDIILFCQKSLYTVVAFIRSPKNFFRSISENKYRLYIKPQVFLVLCVYLTVSVFIPVVNSRNAYDLNATVQSLIDESFGSKIIYTFPLSAGLFLYIYLFSPSSIRNVRAYRSYAAYCVGICLLLSVILFFLIQNINSYFLSEASVIAVIGLFSFPGFLVAIMSLIAIKSHFRSKEEKGRAFISIPILSPLVFLVFFFWFAVIYDFDNSSKHDSEISLYDEYGISQDRLLVQLDATGARADTAYLTVMISNNSGDILQVRDRIYATAKKNKLPGLAFRFNSRDGNVGNRETNIELKPREFKIVKLCCTDFDLRSRRQNFYVDKYTLEIFAINYKGLRIYNVDDISFARN